MKKKILIACMVLVLSTSMVACGSKKGNQGKDPLTGQEITSEASNEDANSGNQNNSATDNNLISGENNEMDFDSMLNQEGYASNIIDYINTNIGDATEMDVKRFFSGLLGYGDDIRDIDFTKLNESKQYMSEDMIAFMELMKLENDTPSMVRASNGDGRVIGLTLSEMLERALLYEQHLKKYPNDVSTDAAQKLYEEVATHAITGGYDKITGTEHYYKGETADVVDKDALQYYKQFADANPDSNLGKIVNEYINVLNNSSFKIDDDMEAFYHSLYEKLQISGAHAVTESTVSGERKITK